MRNGLTHYST